MTLDEIIEAAGGVTQLAKIAGVNHSTVAWWRRHGNRVATVDRAQRISRALGIPLHKIRPDIWPTPEVEAA